MGGGWEGGWEGGWREDMTSMSTPVVREGADGLLALGAALLVDGNHLASIASPQGLK